MKYLIIGIIAFAAAVGFISCKQEIVYEPPVFPKQQQVEVQVLNEQYLFRYANQPLLYDSLLIVGDLNDEAYICAFNRYSGNRVGSFGRKGNGPGELVTPVEYSVDKEKGFLYVNDYGQKSIFKYDLKHWENGIPVYQEIKLSGEIGERNKILHVKDSLFVAKSLFDRLLLATPNRTIQKLLSATPAPQKFQTDKDWYAFTEACACEAISPSGNLYVAATAYGAILEIIPIDGLTIQEPSYRYFYEPVTEQKGHVYNPTPETIFGFFHVSVTDRYIYATAHGKKNPTTMPTSIWKFDLKGKPIIAYQCNVPIESFTVDEEEQLIYAVTYNEEGEQMLGTISLDGN